MITRKNNIEQMQCNCMDDHMSSFIHLIRKRAKQVRSFINDKGFRHINNRDDKTGVTYAFWMIPVKK